MDKKSTLLLTVIAIATLLVAVVGATFAYFTATTQGEANTEVNVTTKTIDTAHFETDQTLNIDASQVNFASGLGSLKGEAKGMVTFTANDAKASSMCYNVSLDITSNDFEYSIDGNTYPELVLDIWKIEKEGKDELSSVDPTSEGTHYTNTLYLADEENNLKYNSDVLTNAKVCKPKSAAEPSTECEESKTIVGFDITTLGSAKGSLSTVKNIPIPNAETDFGSYAAENMKHTISADQGQTKTQYWYFSLTLVNYTDGDKEKAVVSGNQNKNVGKAFNAKINFNSTPCS